MELSSHFSNDCLYRIIETKPKTIEVNKKWINYLLRNYRILIDFCYWNLTLYLQDKNPNVPDIPNKLIKPMERSPLTRQRKFWRGFLDECRMVSEQVFCIYTATPLGAGNFAVEHFTPYSFVSHDLLWNLVPVDPAINASKSNKLPILEQHLDSFSRLQQMGLLNNVAAIIRERFNPDGFNIGINIGRAAGQTVDHVHLHLIPRYEGDVEEPEGGVRGVIPWKQKY